MYHGRISVRRVARWCPPFVSGVNLRVAHVWLHLPRPLYLRGTARHRVVFIDRQHHLLGQDGEKTRGVRAHVRNTPTFTVSERFCALCRELCVPLVLYVQRPTISTTAPVCSDNYPLSRLRFVFHTKQTESTDDTLLAYRWVWNRTRRRHDWSQASRAGFTTSKP